MGKKTNFMDNSMNQSNQWWLPLLMAFMLIIGALAGFMIQGTAPTVRGSSTTTQKGAGEIEEVLRYIEARYVDDVNRDELTEKAITKLLKGLDPHSSYIPARELQGVNEQLSGNFEGVGIEFLIVEDTITVVTPIPGGPSEQVGIQAGDKIVMIEDTVVAGIEIKSEDVVGKLRGKKNTKVNISIMRNNNKKLLPFTITRDKIPLYSIETSYMVDKETGYIKISRFSATTDKEFMEALDKLMNKNLKNLIVDVRQNPGGYLSASTNILNELFENAELLVYTKGRTFDKNEYKSSGQNIFAIDKISVLIDEGSASASEILAGAIQDQDRGVIIGRRSFGKGLVQEQYDLSDGSALRLTVARYYTPSGRSIQKNYDNLDDYDKDLEIRYKAGELSSADSIAISDSTIYRTKKGKVVYGGGGIMPDIFIPLDTIVYNSFYVRAIQYVPTFVYDYIDAHPTKFKKYKTLTSFDKNYDIDDALFAEFIALLKSKDVEGDEEDLALTKPYIKTRLKGYIARQYFKEDGYYYILNQIDPTFKRAVREMKK